MTQNASRCFDIQSDDLLSYNTAMENRSHPHTVRVTTGQHFCRKIIDTRVEAKFTYIASYRAEERVHSCVLGKQKGLE